MACNWDWNEVPIGLGGVPDPLFTIPVHGEELPVIKWPEEYLCDGLREQNIELYILLGFFLRPGTLKTVAAGDMIDRAVKEGVVKPGGELVESTSGGLGDGLAFHATVRRPEYRLKITLIVSDTLPAGKLLPLTRHGANVLKESQTVEMLGLEKSPGGIALAAMYAERFGAVNLNQYGGNPHTQNWNPDSYRRHLAEPIWEGVGGADLFITPVGSRGIIKGLGSAFREWNPKIKLVGVVPYYKQNIDGTRTLTRQREVKHDLKSLEPYTLERIDQAAADKYANQLNQWGIPVGRSGGGGYGSMEHILLNMIEDEEIDLIRRSDGAVRVILPLHDTRFPYDRA